MCKAADRGNYLTECVSPGWEWDSLISCCCVGHFRCHVSLWTSAGPQEGALLSPPFLYSPSMPLSQQMSKENKLFKLSGQDRKDGWRRE